MCRSPYIDWPNHVHIETYAKCNASCNFCPYPVLRRQGERMSDALLNRIITQLTEIPRILPFQISPLKVNEPFLDVRLFDILATINERLPNASIALTTNASPLTANQLKRLSSVKKLQYLWVSCNDYRPDQYEQIMGLPYAKTVERLQMLHASKMRGELPCRVVLSRVADGSEHDAAFASWVKQTWPGFESFLFQRGGWLGQINGQPGEVPAVGCIRWFELSITATGSVAHCCMDGQCDYPLGDVAQQHLLEIYNTSKYRALRRGDQTRQAVSPCSDCTFL